MWKPWSCKVMPDLQGYGNNQANTIYGNAGNNLINGGAGADTMWVGPATTPISSTMPATW